LARDGQERRHQFRPVHRQRGGFTRTQAGVVEGAPGGFDVSTQCGPGEGWTAWGQQRGGVGGIDCPPLQIEKAIHSLVTPALEAIRRGRLQF
jgi:hypothetical protein